MKYRNDFPEINRKKLCDIWCKIYCATLVLACVCVCVCSSSLDTGGRQSPSQPAIPPTGRPACLSVMMLGGLYCMCSCIFRLTEAVLTVCLRYDWQKVWLWAGVRRGRASLDSVNKASTSSSVCPWRSLTSKHQSKTGADIICHQGFPGGEL